MLVVIPARSQGKTLRMKAEIARLETLREAERLARLANLTPPKTPLLDREFRPLTPNPANGLPMAVKMLRETAEGPTLPALQVPPPD